VKKWHPDKVKDPEMQKIAPERFMKIQEAYETLMKITERRKNKKTEL
jgi:DnaJ family protein C protein 22